MGVLEKITANMELIESKKFKLQKAILVMMLEWKHLEEYMDSTQHSFQECLNELQLKEKYLNSVQESAVESNKEMESIRVSIEGKIKKLDDKEREFQVFRDEQVSELDLKEKQLGLIGKSIEERIKLVELREEKLAAKQKVLEGIFKKFKVEEKQFEDIRKSVEERIEEINYKEMQLEKRCKELEFKEKELSDRAREIESMAKQIDMGLNRDAAIKAKKAEEAKRLAELKASAAKKSASEVLPTVDVLADPATAPAITARKAKAPLPPAGAPQPKKRKKSHSRGSVSAEGETAGWSALDTPSSEAETAEDPALVLRHMEHSLSGIPPSLKGYGDRLAEIVFPGEAAKETDSVSRPYLFDVSAVLLSELGACLSSFNIELGRANSSQASLGRALETSKAELSRSTVQVSALEGELEKSKAELLLKEEGGQAEKKAWRAEEAKLKNKAAEKTQAVLELEARVEALAEENARLKEDAAAAPTESAIIDKFTASSQYVDEALSFMERSRVQTFRAAFAAGVLWR